MKIYQSKYRPLWGTTYQEVMKIAYYEYQKIKKRNMRRQPYVRSAYFSKDKIFLNIFWNHLKQKRRGEQVRRARLYGCALDLIRNCRYAPITIVEQTQPHILLHRFAGRTQDGLLFRVQIKENRKTDRKDLISVFPVN